MAHIIVVGNEKGGSGKSTTCMHVATALVRLGFTVGALDLDTRQCSFSRYLENRVEYMRRTNTPLPMPTIGALPNIPAASLAPGENVHDRRVADAVARLDGQNDFVVIDCPGSHTRMSEVAHSLADTLITPLNDSFVDFDLLARTNAEDGKVLGPSVYSEMVWSARQMRAQAGLQPIDWVIVRNRLGTQNMHNKRKVGDALDQLSKRIGFRVSQGFSERVVFREMFPSGLTLLDMRDAGMAGLNLSNVAARQEVRDLVKALNLPDVVVRF
ncbi:MAG: division plane positioning ATPase MipZ [Rhodobacterales bacterium]|jgi:chromosome partitioning protein